MDRRTLAVRRYAQIVPKPAQGAELPLRRLLVWLVEDVCPVLDDYARRPAFREAASWAVRVFNAAADTPERALVDRIDTELSDCARALLKLTGRARMRARLLELFPPVQRAVPGPVIVSGKEARSAQKRLESFDRTAAEIGECEGIAARWWPYLVNTGDYFEPRQEFAKLDSGEYVQLAERVVSLNRGLLPVGNFIVRCLLQRVDQLFAPVASLHAKCLSALEKTKSSYAADRKELDRSWNALSQAVNELRVTLQTGQAMRARDAYVVATQVYAAYSRSPEVSWLGLDEKVIRHGAEMLRVRAKQLQGAEMFERIAAAMEDLRLLYEDSDPMRSSLEEAIATCELVVVEATRQVYWQRESVEIQGDRGWTLFFALARKVRTGSEVGVSDVYGEDAVTQSAMSPTWERLKPQLPPSLAKLIRPGSARATYILDLSSSQVHVIRNADRSR